MVSDNSEVERILDEVLERDELGKEVSIDSEYSGADEVIRQEVKRRLEDIRRIDRLIDVATNPSHDSLFRDQELDLRPGDSIRGLNDKLVEFLGRGGFGEVWKVENCYTGMVTALKFCGSSPILMGVFSTV